jgi:RNA polymerase sigma-70 factor (sigma-E family)
MTGVPGSRESREQEFATFVAGRARSLRRTAYLLTGDWHAAEDLTQTMFIRLYGRWDGLARRDALDAYARKTLVRLYIDERRRKRSTEQVVADAPEGSGRLTDDETEARLDMLRALAALPARQRAVLVLRFWEDLDVATVAQLVGCPEGTVKSLTSRGLDALRAQLGVELAAATDGVEER